MIEKNFDVGLLEPLDERLNLGRISFRNVIALKSESDWVHFCHTAPPQGDDQMLRFFISFDEVDSSFRCQ
jgi:hypothetical protein